MVKSLIAYYPVEVMMKEVPFDENHTAFMVHTIDYLRDNGIHMPSVSRTHLGEEFLKING
ncbi:hypothetical protein D1953_08925 [Peribacillus asahii]|uniref:Uncharacterized protein n=1 Tax=Peribacillus asahii TaxID=228899 RepID=A0A398BFV9_9BACI|nr:hypothetical protein D1953_08925 [Peribacillus asahii]